MHIVTIGRVTDPIDHIESTLLRSDENAVLGFTDDAGSSYIVLKRKMRASEGGNDDSRNAFGNATSTWQIIKPPHGLPPCASIAFGSTIDLEVIIEVIRQGLFDLPRVVAITL